MQKHTLLSKKTFWHNHSRSPHNTACYIVCLCLSQLLLCVFSGFMYLWKHVLQSCNDILPSEISLNVNIVTEMLGYDPLWERETERERVEGGKGGCDRDTSKGQKESSSSHSFKPRFFALSLSPLIFFAVLFVTGLTLCLSCYSLRVLDSNYIFWIFTAVMEDALTEAA